MIEVRYAVDDEVLKARISEVKLAMSDLRRLTSRPFAELSVDEKYSIRYTIIVLIESFTSLCMHIAVETYAARSTSYREGLELIANTLA